MNAPADPGARGVWKMLVQRNAGRYGWRGPGALLLALAILWMGCASPPDKALADAEKALREAAVVSECAEGEFKEAEEMLAAAKRLVEEGRYDEAEVKAKGARTLAERAKASGEKNWDECQKKKREAEEARRKATEKPVEIETPDSSQLQTIYFEYNESALSDRGQAALKSNAEWMRRFPEINVVVQGHCDERGSTEYNVALGERRAQSVRKYLIQLGIQGSRLSVLSFGEEVPVSGLGTEEGHALNRRAEFVVR